MSNEPLCDAPVEVESTEPEVPVAAPTYGNAEAPPMADFVATEAVTEAPVVLFSCDVVAEVPEA